jgi:hypothetical protein
MARSTKIIFMTSNRLVLGAKFYGQIPSLPRTLAKTAIPDTLHTNLRIIKTLLTLHRYRSA